VVADQPGRQGRGDCRAPLGAPDKNRGGEPSPHELARASLIELGYAAAEADELLIDASGESAEELVGDALRGARAAG